MKLQDRLDAFKADFEAGKPPYNMPLLGDRHHAPRHRRTDRLQAPPARRSGPAKRRPRSRSGMPRAIRSASAALLRKGPLVVSFYRGIWCPYCNMELQALEAFRAEFEKLGGTLIAISPQTVPNSRKSARQNGLNFPILSDPRGAVAAAFGLRFALPDYLVELYKNLKDDLPSFNDDPDWTLPMPARYVIAEDGTIRYAEINPDETRRPEPQEMLPALRQAAEKRAA